MEVGIDGIYTVQDKKVAYTKRSFSIGTNNETSLHSQIKKLYAGSNGIMEACVDGSIIDIVKDDILIEIQTKNFSALGKKIAKLVDNHKIRVVHPIGETKWIITTDKDGKQLRKRKSPKNGELIDLFDELVSIPKFMNESNFSLEIIMIELNEIRCSDGKGSWRRKGVSIKDRELIKINSSVLFNSKEDFLNFIPENIPENFTCKTFSECSGIQAHKARKALYCMKKMELVRECGKKGNAIIYTINV